MATATPTRPPVFNLPNQLTAGRLGLALILFVLIEWHSWIACAMVFAVAAFTDWLDGYLARKQGLTSTLGRNMDPLVDKVLVCGSYIFLLPVDNAGLTAWMVTVVVSRELIITGLRGFMETTGINFGADWLGKIKMVLQCITLLAIFFFLALLASATTTEGRASSLAREMSREIFLSGQILLSVGGYQINAVTLFLIRDILIYLTVFITALSGLQYIWRAFSILRMDPARIE